MSNEQTVDKLTELFQKTMSDNDTARRAKDPDDPPRRHVFDEQFRNLAREVLDEIDKHTTRKLGVPSEIHAEHHLMMQGLIPWIHADKIKRERQAAFWESLREEITRDGVKFAVKWGLLFVFIAIGLGASGAWSHIIDAIAR